jgi:hypothetical protein
MTSRRYSVVVNGRSFSVDLPTLRPVQIRALAGIPADHSLVAESIGPIADRLLADDESISLESAPAVIYSKPPTAFGILLPPDNFE